MSEKRDLRIFLTDILNATEKIIRYNQEKESSQNVRRIRILRLSFTIF